ncbi:MAG: dTDP-4-dehydrorhamnose 3,5-epimerase [Pseudomonadota bacterium]
MQIDRFDIEGPALLTPPRFGDRRGFFSETFHAERFAEAIGPAVFVQDNHSRSGAAGTLRGLHLQSPPHAQGKLVRVVRGRIFDVAVDLREESPSYGGHVAVELSAENWAQLWVPAGFAHGFLTLEPDTEVVYKATAFYAPEHEAGIAWDDPDLAIEWPLRGGGAPSLSEKDARLPRFAEFRTPFRRADAEGGS